MCCCCVGRILSCIFALRESAYETWRLLRKEIHLSSKIRGQRTELFFDLLIVEKFFEITTY